MTTAARSRRGLGGPIISPPTVTVAVAGCGVVGGELIRQLRSLGSCLEWDHAVRYEVVGVLVRDSGRARSVDLPHGILTTDVETFLSTGADVVVEAIGGLEPAAMIARATLARGARYVTANKAVVAAHGEELLALARQHGGWLDFEAAVGGGIPVVRVLRESLAAVPIRRIWGILNGTTNYVLTRMEQGATFSESMHLAREEGFAEADCGRDLDGQDAADKIAILAWLAFGIDPAAVQVHRRGILPDPERLCREAAERGGCVRLVAECVAGDGGVWASVAPAIVARGSDFGRTVDEQNRIVIDLGWGGTVGLSGPGAGGAPTAAALLGDLICPARPIRGRESLAPWRP